MIPPVSPMLLKVFTRYGRRYVGRHFHAVRVSRTGGPPALSGDTPLVVYMNHPSWWDPMIGLVLADHFQTHRRHYAPMEAAALDRYRFFGRLGFFGVDQGSPRGAATFLKTSLEILEQPDAVLWLTAEGRFTDPRVRPVRLRPGLGHLARLLKKAAILPLALEYVFWQERFPEVLACFGQPVRISDHPNRNARAWTALLEERLQMAQDHLAAQALRRRPDDFQSVLLGRAGVGFFYDAWRRLRATLAGKRFHAEHGDPLA